MTGRAVWAHASISLGSAQASFGRSGGTTCWDRAATACYRSCGSRPNVPKEPLPGCRVSSRTRWDANRAAAWGDPPSRAGRVRRRTGRGRAAWRNHVKIALAHDPAGAFVRAADGVAFAGHTLCGHVRLPFVRALWVPASAPREATCGLCQDADRTLYVTAGAGASVLPLRPGAPSAWDMVTRTRRSLSDRRPGSLQFDQVTGAREVAPRNTRNCQSPAPPNTAADPRGPTPPGTAAAGGLPPSPSAQPPRRRATIASRDHPARVQPAARPSPAAMPPPSPPRSNRAKPARHGAPSRGGIQPTS